MYKALFAFFILLSSYVCSAQNYQCLQAGVKRYYTNSNGYLRGMRIDSVKTVGSTKYYYPFHTARGDYQSGAELDSNGGSWLGKEVIVQADGTFLFDNIWHDTIVLKTQANTGDAWILYNDTTQQYYTATVVSSDTLTVLGVTDSIKKIRINAYNAAGADTADDVDNFELILSKNHGFAQVFDLYTFPYHGPDTTYERWNDYYLDYLTGSISCSMLDISPNPSNAYFSLISFINPTYEQLYDWNPGDVFENKTFDWAYSTDGFFPYRYYCDTITSKTTLPGGTRYDFKGWMATQHMPDPWPWHHNPSTNYPYDTASTLNYFIVPNTLLIDTFIMPEEKNPEYFYYYFPLDNSFCIQSCKYGFETTGISNYVVYSPSCEGGGPSIYYKTGIGLLNYNINILGGSPPLMQDTTLLFYIKNTIPCGTYVVPSPIYSTENVADVNTEHVTIYPNPASDEISITTTVARPYTISVMNLVGQVMMTKYSSIQKEQINISMLPDGLYYVSINYESGSSYREKMVIQH